MPFKGTFAKRTISFCIEDMIKDLLLFTLKLVMSSKQSLALFHYDDVSYV